jgi:hypothetical protein
MHVSRLDTDSKQESETWTVRHAGGNGSSIFCHKYCLLLLELAYSARSAINRIYTQLYIHNATVCLHECFLREVDVANSLLTRGS